MVKRVETLAIVSHVAHYRSGSRIFAYGPYTREIDIWADLFPRVVIAAPLRQGHPPSDCLPLTRNNVELSPIKETGGQTITAKLGQVVSLPSLTASLCAAMRKADAIHVRCPGNLGLLGVVLAPLFSRFVVAKYAGQWNGYPGEPLTVRLQRALLRSAWWRGPVTVYGKWPEQPEHVISFFTSILTSGQMARAGEVAAGKGEGGKLRVLYAGRLSASKNVDTLLDSIAGLRNVSCRIAGGGPERATLQERAVRLGIADRVEFTGPVPFDEMARLYEWADALVLTSETEGWPKSVAEAMAHGVICIGSNRGFVPQMLAGGRGIVVPPRDVAALASALREIGEQPERIRPMRLAASRWAQAYTLEGLREALRDLLASRWGADLRTPEAGPRVEKARE